MHRPGQDGHLAQEGDHHRSSTDFDRSRFHLTPEKTAIPASKRKQVSPRSILCRAGGFSAVGGFRQRRTGGFPEGRQFGLANPERKRGLTIRQLLTRVTRPLSPGGIGEKQAALGVDDENPVRKAVQRLTQQRQRKGMPRRFFLANELPGQKMRHLLQHPSILSIEAVRFVGDNYLSGGLGTTVKRANKEISQGRITKDGEPR
jgi:hypothetical protein